MTTEAGQEKKAGEELFFVALTKKQVEALRQDATGASTLAHVELDEDRESFWAEVGHRLDAAKPQSTVTGLVEAAEGAFSACKQGAIGIDKGKADQEYVEMLEGAAVELKAALSAYKQEVE